MAAAATAKTLATTTYNTDVHSIVRRYNRALVEVYKSQSSGVSQTLPFDVTRIKGYLANINSFLDWIVAQPLLDCPETGPSEIPLPTNPSINYIENESAFDVMQLIMIARDEIANSQSARIPTNLVIFDFNRQKAYLKKISNLLDFIETSEPLDLPESSPMVAMSGPGNQGV